ncbi:DUF2383 domain-containing protein [Algibacter mikhailovii]|uniref:DUF2383 domain-containing protein n=1 Tax=Algibacter mikhailovii TaxID=425498 RepID=A0A918R493_9FLAO|nr:DUF2383 domain-containing protein [Algibacter mikhailovii]GGZ85567.1 hypothetical protein GCM10007028_24790 [Algibacter mikhailovii]
MKRFDVIIEKMNDLLIMNDEAEKIYFELLEKTSEEELKIIFKESSLERNEFGKNLKLEILKLNGEPEYSRKTKSDLYKHWMNLRNFLLFEDDKNLLEEVYNLKAISVKKYNELLSEMSLPLSTCKLLLRQRDTIEDGMVLLKRHKEAYVA